MDLASIGARALQNRHLARAPIWLYRHGLGGLLGQRLLLLEHTGRRSGRARFVCLEVVERRTPQTVTVVSGFGARAQWYRNLAAHPGCHVTIARHRWAAHARRLGRAEADATLARYQVAHPRAWANLRAVIERAVGHQVEGLPSIELTLGPPVEVSGDGQRAPH